MSTENLKIRIPAPAWNSKLTSTILELEKLRSKTLYEEIPSYIFFQLKSIFHMLETLGSARIEGNNTTLSERVEKIIENKTKESVSDEEISNLNEAITFIEKNINHEKEISKTFISELHKIITQNLPISSSGEGSKNPGDLRTHNVQIAKSDHTPPDHVQLPDYFKEFLQFINHPFAEQDQLLMVAISHHRFVYIHPFDNGNGRVGRLLNYALLVKLGFNVSNARIINPSSIFYSDRSKYYDMLATADSLNDSDVLQWAEYFLLGLKNEIDRIDNLLNRTYVYEKIILPALTFALDHKTINKQEFEILNNLSQQESFTMKAKDLNVLDIKSPVQKSRFIAHMRERKIVRPLKEKGRIYTISFVNNYLLRGVIQSLKDQGYIPDFLE